MIIAKAPLRVSYLGGGSDFPAFFSRESSFVLGTTINKFVYTAINPLQDFAEQKYRVTYRSIDSVSSIEEIGHPIVREVLKYFGWNTPLNIATLADIPGNSGLGSSSAFTVSLISALNLAANFNLSQEDIAKLAVMIETEILGELGGVQDQFHSAIGGFRMYEFSDKKHTYTKPLLSYPTAEYISDRQWLYPVGAFRSSSKAHQDSVHFSKSSESLYQYRRELSQNAYSFFEKISMVELESSQIYDLIVDAVNCSWKIKSQQSGVTNEKVNQIIKRFNRAGVDAIKLCGAGQGGFLLILADPDCIQKVSDGLNPKWIINARIEPNGCMTAKY